MTWMWVVLAAWALLAVAVALVIGRSIHAADRKRQNAPNFAVDAPAPQPRIAHPGEFDDLQFDAATPQPSRRSGTHSVVQNCVPAAERTPAQPPTLPHPRS